MSEKILLICEDDPDIGKLLGIYLKMQGWNHLIVKNGGEVMPIMKEQNVGLLLLDLGLPDIYGTEIAKQVKNDPSTRNIPVVYFSANTRLHKAMEEAPVDGVLSKPFELEDLKKVISKYLV